MKEKNFNLVMVFLLPFMLLNAGNKPKIAWQFEFGSNTVLSSINDKWEIRQDVGNIDYYSQSSRVYTEMYITQLGIRPEVSFFDNKVSLSSGLRYFNVKSELYTNTWSSGSLAYFYLRYANSGLNTEFARVYGINETSHYLGIPLEVKFTPLSIWKLDFYVKTGIDLACRLAKRTNIDFVNDEMKDYEDMILKNTGATTSMFTTTWNSAVGATLGDRSKFRYSLEILLPSFYLTGNSSSLMNADMFSGFRILLQLPAK